MTEKIFPKEIPEVGALLRVTPIQGEPLSKGEYKFFCEEAHVISRVFLIDYTDRKYVLVYLGGIIVVELRFSFQHLTRSTNFGEPGNKQTIQVEIEEILE